MHAPAPAVLHSPARVKPALDGQHPKTLLANKNPTCRDNFTSTPLQSMPRTDDGFFRAPRFIRVLFGAFPLVTLPVDPPPERGRTIADNAADDSNTTTLFVFGAEDGAPSFNPACLKWQTFLRIRGVDFRTEPSSNHASPSGSLPFLVVEGSRTQTRLPAETVTAGKLARWIEDNAASSVNTVDVDGADYRAFQTLLDTSIRDAWLYAMYVDADTLHGVTAPRYTATTPTWPVTAALAAQMRRAALASIRSSSSTSTITGRTLYARAEGAWEALSTLLGTDRWFFGAQDAGLFDASVFAYVHLILAGEKESGSGAELASGLRRHANLIQHEARIRSRWYP
ncbi:Metaxin-3 [Drechslerella dactyloides]|uniref:Metaxin-3 n=1 Tax=Drechslerella dactyloides TaxID=74499 RepID=A0AAD6IT92_DREDA|nr:Metaxin-3 [Drechslerella dactyloides]